jgi:hypothetical protein
MLFHEPSTSEEEELLWYVCGWEIVLMTKEMNNGQVGEIIMGLRKLVFAERGSLKPYNMLDQIPSF